MNKRSIGGLVAIGIGIAVALYAPARESVAPLFFEKEEPVRVLFVGDLMLDRNVARSAEEEGIEALISSSTVALFANADLRVANLEGTITTNPSIARRDNKILHFTFDPTLARAVLKRLNINAVSLANNHALDFGEEGFWSTYYYLEGDIDDLGFGIQTFGHPQNESLGIDQLTAGLEAKGKSICLVGFHSLFSPSVSPIVKEITALKEGDCWRIVVFAHWGDEYEPVASDAQKEAAHAFIDAGADLVIGAHPHVVQNIEIYQGKAIFYSLGNFIFDQNFSWATMHGLAVRADFYEDHTAFVLTPLTIAEQHASVAAGADKDRILRATGQVAEFRLP